MYMPGKGGWRSWLLLPYSFAFFRRKDFETWGLLSQSLGTACLGGIFSHMAYSQWMWGVPGQYSHCFLWRNQCLYLCLISVEHSGWCEGVAGLLWGVSGGEREALRKHPAKRQASLSGNFPSYKLQASILEGWKDRYSLWGSCVGLAAFTTGRPLFLGHITAWLLSSAAFGFLNDNGWKHKSVPHR